MGVLIFIGLICATELDRIEKRLERMEEKMVTREEFKLFVEMTNKRFTDLQNYMDKRFEDIYKRFEDMNRRFIDLQNYMDKRFEDMNKRFEDIMKILSAIIGLIGAMIGILIYLAVMIGRVSREIAEIKRIKPIDRETLREFLPRFIEAIKEYPDIRKELVEALKG